MGFRSSRNPRPAVKRHESHQIGLKSFETTTRLYQEVVFHHHWNEKRRGHYKNQRNHTASDKSLRQSISSTTIIARQSKRRHTSRSVRTPEKCLPAFLMTLHMSFYSAEVGFAAFHLFGDDKVNTHCVLESIKWTGLFQPKFWALCLNKKTFLKTLVTKNLKILCIQKSK